MKIRKEQIEEYKQLYKEDFDQELTDAEASQIIHRLVALYEVLSTPLPSEQEHHRGATQSGI